MSTKFFCATCSCSFSRKYLLSQHLKSNKHLLREQNTTSLFSCTCGKSYTHKKSLLLHQKTCSTYKNQIISPTSEEDNSNQALREEINELKEKQIIELNELKDQIKTLKNSNTTQNASNIQNNTNSHNNVTININPFGQENVDMISPECFIHCLNRIYNSSPALAEQIYSYSENQNIRIPNKNKPYVSVQLENGKSKLQLLEKVLDEIENFCYTLLEEKFTDPEYRQQMSEMKQRAFENYMNAYENDDKGTVKKNIRNALKLLLLNMTEEAKQ